jgi:hypothetical protein
MEKTTTMSYADPNGKIDIRKLTRREDGTCPLSEAKDQGSEKVVRDTRK